MDSKPFTLCVLNSFARADLVRRAQTRVVYCGPGLTQPEMEALLSLRTRLSPDALIILVDFRAETLRVGYWGDQTIIQLAEITNMGSPVQIAAGIRLGLLVVDNEAFIFTPLAQSVESEKSDSNEPNALRLDAEETQRLVASIISNNPPQRPLVSKEDIKRIEEDLDKGYQGSPSKQRLLESIRQRIKIIQFEVRGYQLGRRRIQLPDRVIEILGSEKNEINERLAASWKLFESGNRADQELAELQKALSAELDKIKENYLQRVGTRTYGLPLKLKSEFEAAWAKFQAETVENYRNMLGEKVGAMITESQNLLRELLKERVKSGRLHVPTSKTLFQRPREEEERDFIESLIKSVRWPTVEQVTTDIVVKMRQYDITLELLEDKEFVKEIEKAFDFKLDELLKEKGSQQANMVVQPFPFSLN